MSEIPHSGPEKEKPVADDARKFIIASGGNVDFLPEDSGVHFELITDWLETNDDSEKKVVRKEFPDGSAKMLLISKETTDGKRTSVKKEIQQAEYEQRIAESTIRVEKIRHEFLGEQDGMQLKIKYDEFFGPNNLRMLEVDAGTEEERARFNPSAFSTGDLVEVYGRGYEGYRIADKI